MTRAERITALHAAAHERILVLDGSWGVMIQRMELSEEEVRGPRFAAHPRPLQGDNDLLCLTCPERVIALHDAYFEARADIASTNSFTATSISQADYGLEALAPEIARTSAELARQSADRWSTPDRPRWVAGCIGPTNKTLSISPDVNDPARRAVTFDELYAAYREQALALHAGGADIFLVETIFDTLNAKAAIKAILDLEDEGLEPCPYGSAARSSTVRGAHCRARRSRPSGTPSATPVLSPSA